MNLPKKILVTLLFSTALASCDDSASSSAGESFSSGVDDNSSNQTAFDEASVISGLIENVFNPANDSFEQQTAALITTVQNYCTDIEQNNDSSTSLTAAQNAWRNTMNAWQQIEVMQVGPLLSNDGNLRNTIYSWPTTSQCAVDQDVGLYEQSRNGGDDYDISRRTNSRKGLDAAEYLLFNANLNHSCPNDSLAPDGWNDRPDAEKQLARCEFALEVATDLNNSATALKNQWIEDDGFANDLQQAGQDDSQFDDTHSAINHITDAMFYVDSITKDLKLASPIGLATNSCGNASCLDDVESLFAENTVANVKHNLIALQSLFLGAPVGTDGIGFDDYLIFEQHQELVDTMSADIQAAIDAANAFEGTMSDAVTTYPERVQELHAAVKTVTDNLKSMFITYLSLELPITSAGDAD